MKDPHGKYQRPDILNGKRQRLTIVAPGVFVDVVFMRRYFCARLHLATTSFCVFTHSPTAEDTSEKTEGDPAEDSTVDPTVDPTVDDPET